MLVHPHDLDLGGFSGTKRAAAASAAAATAAGCEGGTHGARTTVDTAANTTLSRRGPGPEVRGPTVDVLVKEANRTTA